MRRTAERVFIPLTVGGGVRAVDDARRLLRAGADKVGVNSAAVARPELLGELARRFGSQCVVLSVDARRVGDGEGRWEVVTHGGRRPTGRDALAWIREGVERGAGEILLTCIDGDGTRAGYDLELVAAACRAVPVPVIASGGAGTVGAPGGGARRRRRGSARGVDLPPGDADTSARSSAPWPRRASPCVPWERREHERRPSFRPCF